MRTLNLPTEKVEIWKTGLPFYDAARLIGAAHLLFGTASAEVEDEGSRWVLRGPKTIQRREAEHIKWVTQGVPGIASKTQRYLESLPSKIEEILSHFEGNKIKQDKNLIGRYDEPALQQGIRGIDPLRSYSLLASMGGDSSTVSLPEAVVVTLGRAFAAQARDESRPRQRNRQLILPIFRREHFVLGPFLDFRHRRYSHMAGVFVAAVWTSLEILDELMAIDIPAEDFAYSWVIEQIPAGVVQSSSGYVGVDRICRLMQKRKDEGRDFYFARQARDYLNGTRRDPKRSDVLPVEHDMARALARFATTADVKHLETIVRLKARLTAQEDGWPKRRADRLFNNRETIEEVREMTEQQVAVPEGMTRALAAWFTGGGKDGWIGNFIKLENRSSPERFLDEAERILSRAKMHKEAPVDYRPRREEQELLDRVRAMNTPQFRGFRAVFLLDLQAKMTYEGRRSAASSQDATETPQEGNDNE